MVEKHLGEEMTEATLTEAEVEAVKNLMLLYIDKIEADLLGCEVINVTDTEPEPPALTMQTYLDEVDTPNGHPLVEEGMFEAMDTDDHLDTETENLAEDETTEVTLTEAEVEAIKELMLLFIEKIEAESLGCEVMSAADEVEASTHNMQTHLDETDPSNDQLLDVEKKSDDEADWNTIKGLMADLLNDVQRTVDQSLAGNEIHKDADIEVEADDINKLTDTQLDDTKTTFNEALDVEMTVEPEPIKSWADIVDEIEGNIYQTAEIVALKKDTPENETKRDQRKKNTRRGTRGKETATGEVKGERLKHEPLSLAEESIPGIQSDPESHFTQSTAETVLLHGGCSDCAATEDVMSSKVGVGTGSQQICPMEQEVSKYDIIALGFFMWKCKTFEAQSKVSLGKTQSISVGGVFFPKNDK
ncbi:hypothetical protein MHYP_G00356560 [Metynnis hypsauchen]